MQKKGQKVRKFLKYLYSIHIFTWAALLLTFQLLEVKKKTDITIPKFYLFLPLVDFTIFFYYEATFLSISKFNIYCKPNYKTLSTQEGVVGRTQIMYFFIKGVQCLETDENPWHREWMHLTSYHLSWVLEKDTSVLILHSRVVIVLNEQDCNVKATLHVAF